MAEALSDRLLRELSQDPGRREQWRRLLLGEPVMPPGRLPGPRRTYCWYLPVALAEKVQARAREEGTVPSEVAARILARAVELGWL